MFTEKDNATIPRQVGAKVRNEIQYYAVLSGTKARI